MDIVIWKDKKRSGYCKLASAALWPGARLDKGVSASGDYPGLTYEMDKNFPDDLELSDNFGVAGQIIVSGKLKARLQDKLPDHDIEFLQIDILNHKGRLASDDYFILHPLGLRECIDLKRSKVKWNPLLKNERIMSCAALVLTENSIPESVKLFRPAYWGTNIMATRELADELTAEGFTGLRFVEAEGFDGIA